MIIPGQVRRAPEPAACRALPSRYRCRSHRPPQSLSDGDEANSGEYHEYGEDEPNECHAAAGGLDIPEGPEDECGFEMFVSGRVFG